MSLHPFKLLRFMCFGAVGACGELSLSTEYPVNSAPYDSPSTNPLSVDFLPDGNLDVYYHVQAGEQNHIFPINRTMDSYLASSTSSYHDQMLDFRTRLLTSTLMPILRVKQTSVYFMIFSPHAPPCTRCIYPMVVHSISHLRIGRQTSFSRMYTPMQCISHGDSKPSETTWNPPGIKN
ncbi:hypothetical protein DFH29DRAFT_1027207, partial [Suillus ampliporus]